MDWDGFHFIARDAQITRALGDDLTGSSIFRQDMQWRKMDQDEAMGQGAEKLRR